jgi:hypothetical protein
MGAGELMGGGADVHMRVVQDEVFGVHQLALEPERNGCVGKILAFDKAVADRTGPHPLVEARQKILGAGERTAQGVQGQFCKFVSHLFLYSRFAQPKLSCL